MSAPDENTNPSNIVEQLQTLTDIEADLADTALAVMDEEPESPSVVQAEVPPVDEGLQEQSAEPTASTAEDVLLENAEAVEIVLEAAIPGSPSHAVPSSSDPLTQPTQEYTEAALAQGSISADTNDISHTLSAVQADLDVPILPEEAHPSAHDTAAETATEEETSKIIVDVEEPNSANVAEAVANPENTLAFNSTSVSEASRTILAEDETATGEGALAPAPTPAIAAIHPSMATAQQGSVSTPPSAPAPTAVDIHSFAPQQPSFADLSLPEGLSLSSPSVLANRDLIYAYSNDPKNPMVLLSLFNWAVQKTEIVDARAWYESLSVDNPTAVQPLLALINLELALSNFAQVEALFARALKGTAGGLDAAADVNVWSAYLHYIRRQNPLSDGTPNAEAVSGTVTRAYEFALKECGYDRESGEIWEEYIKFVAETPAKNQWETQAQNDNLRKLYQRAVCIPLNNIESLWKSYDAFESNLNKLTAKKFLAERSPAYMTARTALREMRTLTDALPHPILPPTPAFDHEDRRITMAWKAYLKWEEGNPLVIEDQEVLAARISYALRRCLAEMRHFPELWHYAASYYYKTGKQDEAMQVLKSGVQACPKSFLLTFALAEAEEANKNNAECHSIFTKLLESLSPDIDELRKTIASEVEAARGPEIPGAATVAAAADDVDMNGEATEVQKLVEEREERGKLVAERRGKDVEELQVGMSVVWIMYMRFARRADGIKGARGVFGKARKSPHITWHVFEASAMMEYHSNKDSAVAIRIFELGFKLFSEDVEFVIRYLQFLMSINDDNNARALFERSAAKIPSDRSRPLWDTWAKYEYTYGDLSSVHKLEQRFADTFPNDSPLKRFAQRYTYDGIDEIARRDLGFGLKNRPVAPAGLAPNGIGLAPPFAPQTSGPALASGSGPMASLPPAPAPVPVAAPSNSPGGYKRPAPDSPRNRRSSVDPSRSPKRYRANSPPRRYPDRERERDRVASGSRYPPVSNGHGHGHGRDRSPVRPPTHGGRRDERSSLPPVASAGPYGHQLPIGAASGGTGPAQERDRSGVGHPLAWFISSLPTARSFDGPIFRPDDIIGLFSSISHAGTGYGAPPAPAPAPVARGGYPEPDRRYGAPPMRGGRY